MISHVEWVHLRKNMWDQWARTAAGTTQIRCSRPKRRTRFPQSGRHAHDWAQRTTPQGSGPQIHRGFNKQHQRKDMQKKHPMNGTKEHYIYLIYICWFCSSPACKATQKPPVVRSKKYSHFSSHRWAPGATPRWAGPGGCENMNMSKVGVTLKKKVSKCKQTMLKQHRFTCNPLGLWWFMLLIIWILWNEKYS